MHVTDGRLKTASAMATVLTCHYDMRAGQALAFGIPADKHFHITFNYWATTADGAAELHTGDFYSAKAIPQGTLFPVTYDPEQPHQHNRVANTRPPLIAIGLIGSVLLSAAWFFLLRGCR
jgi:hypothetical protein